MFRICDTTTTPHQKDTCGLQTNPYFQISPPPQQKLHNQASSIATPWQSDWVSEITGVHSHTEKIRRVRRVRRDREATRKKFDELGELGELGEPHDGNSEGIVRVRRVGGATRRKFDELGELGDLGEPLDGNSTS